MPALTKRSVGSSAGISEELFTTVWPRSSKNLRNRRRISSLFMKLFYFLSNGVLLISKTSKSPKKTSRITRLERRTQFPILDSSCQHLLKRGPVGAGKDFLGKRSRHTASRQFFPQ